LIIKNNQSNTQSATPFQKTQPISKSIFNPISIAKNVSNQSTPKKPTSNNLRDMGYVNLERVISIYKNLKEKIEEEKIKA
jgi:hypothetical protein